MTEKRFTFEKEKIIRNTTCRIYDEDKILFEVNFDWLENMNSKEVEELCGFLNRLNNENEQLKQENYKLNSKIKSQMEELAICYEKLGW